MTPRHPRPAYLEPKATHLPEGHDDTLDNPDARTDAVTRSRPPEDWPAVSDAKGGDEPPDEPLAPPPTDPAARTLAPFDWVRELPPRVWQPPRIQRSGRPEGEPVTGLDDDPEAVRALLGVQGDAFVGDLDPDIAMWPVTILQRWPFTGPPPTGVWPKGWMGVDNQTTIWICIQGGQPATWEAVGTGGTGPVGPPGPAGPVGPAGPQGAPGMALIQRNVLGAPFPVPTGSFSSPIVSVNVAAGHRYLVTAQGNASKTAAQANSSLSFWIYRSIDDVLMVGRNITLLSNNEQGFYMEFTDVPTSNTSYWLLGLDDVSTSTVDQGADMIAWQVGP